MIKSIIDELIISAQSTKISANFIFILINKPNCLINPANTAEKGKYVIIENGWHFIFIIRMKIGCFDIAHYSLNNAYLLPCL